MIEFLCEDKDVKQNYDILDFQVKLATLNPSVFTNTKIKDMKWQIMKKWF